MSLRISCPACKVVMAVNDDVRGRNVRCPGCGTVLAVPGASSGQQAAGSDSAAVSLPPPAPRAEAPIAMPIQQASQGIQEPPQFRAATTTPTQQRELGSVKTKVAGALASVSTKSGVPIVALLAGGGAVLFLFALICVVSVGYLLLGSAKKPGNAPADRLAKKTMKAKDEPKSNVEEPVIDAKPDPIPEPAIDPNAGKPLPAQMSEETVKRVKGATAYLRVTRPGNAVMEGSGFFAIQPGIVITNAHVLGMLREGSQAPLFVQVTLNSGEANEVKLDGAVVGVDRQSDLGIVRIGDSPFLPQPLFLESDRKPFETQKVYIFGFPFGASLGANITISESSISSLRKNASGGLKEIQVNGGMNPGNSGGPVVNSFGNVVGVAVSIIRGTQINFAVPAENVRAMMDGRLTETILGDPYLQNGQTHLPVRFNCLDPLNKVRELRVDVWIGSPGEPRASMNLSQPAMPGDGQRQTHRVAFLKGVGGLDVPLPPLPAGKVYWLQPSVTTGRGVQWETSVPLAGPLYPLERKPADLVVSLTDPKERTVKLKCSQSLTIVTGKTKKVQSYKIEADVLEVLSPDPKGAIKRTSFGPTVISSEVDGRVTTDVQVTNLLRQIAPAYLLDGFNKVQARSDRNLNPQMQPALRQNVIDTYAQFCNSMEAVTVPMPNRTLQPKETWQTQIPLILSGGARAEVVDLALTCTFEGTRARDQRNEGFITLGGTVKGRGLNANKTGGNVTGKVAFDLAGGYIAQALFKISSDQDLQGADATRALDIHLERRPGNPLNISAPTEFKAGPGLNQGMVLEGNIVLKLDGTLAATDPPCPHPNLQGKNARMKVHPVMLQAGKTYAIALNSGAFDSYLVLNSPQGQVVAEDDDSGGSLNALILYTPTQAGMYRITATAFDGQLGAYQLTVLELAAKK